MEAHAGMQLITDGQILWNAMLNVGVVIGDEDSSMIAAVRRNSDKSVYKLSDKNHLVKNFTGELYHLANSKDHNHKELKRTGVIPHFKRCFVYGIAQNKGKPIDLCAAILNIPDHFYNSHENCCV